LAPTVNPTSTVTMSIRDVRAVRARRSVTPHSLSRLPKKSMASRMAPPGAMIAVTKKVITGKNIFSFLETWRGGFMRIRRSLGVVSSFMIGGWITGTKAI